MSKHTRKLPWCDITIDGAAGRILVTQKWKYDWLLDTSTTADTPSAWTDDEKTAFHANASSAITKAWSRKATFTVAGESEFAKTYSTTSFSLGFQIRHVTAGSHWKVNVTKTKAGKFLSSEIVWAFRTIKLDTNDMSSTLKYISPDAKVRVYQIPVAHEFGHTIGNVRAKKRGDEYRASSPYSDDYRSIMHSGNLLRKRHFLTVDEELDKVVPNTTFSLRAIS